MTGQLIPAEAAPADAMPATTTTLSREILQEKMDFIRTYVSYADVLEAPTIMHEAVGVQIVASVLNRNEVRIPHGALCYPLELWLVLLSGSGHGRSTLVKLAEPVLQGAELEDLTRNTQWGSPQAFYQQMANNPSGLFVWGEMSEKLKLLNDARFGGVKQWLTDRYDNLGIPESITYRESQKKSQDTPPIRFEVSPRTNILATSSEDWFFNNLAHEDSAGGFVPRWMLVRATDPGRSISTPLAPDQRALEALTFDLIEISKIRGNADLHDILPCYDQWYGEAKQRFASQPNPALASAYFNRHRVHIIKLAVIYEASKSLSLRPSWASWTRAVRAAKRLETTIFSLLSTGMNREGFAVSQMEDRIRGAGVDGLPLSEFTRAFQHENKAIRQQRLQTLVACESVFAFQRKTAGRSAVMLVHGNALKQYQSHHPEEQRAGI